MRRIVFSLVTMALTGALAMCGGAFSLDEQPDGDAGLGGGASSTSESSGGSSVPGDSGTLDDAEASTGDHHSPSMEAGPPPVDATTDGGGGGGNTDSGSHEAGGSADGSVHDASGITDGPFLFDVISCPPCGDSGGVLTGALVVCEQVCPLDTTQTSH